MATQSIAQLLKTAREGRGLSQRALGERVGIPQSHISKIERGAVDLQISSLIQLARALDLEVALLPRAALSVIDAFQPPMSSSSSTPSGLEEYIQGRLATVSDLTHSVSKRYQSARLFKGLSATVHELLRLSLRSLPRDRAFKMLDTVNELRERLRKLRSKQSKNEADLLISELETLHEKLRDVRNAIVHGDVNAPSKQVPAYRLDDDGGDNA